VDVFLSGLVCRKMEAEMGLPATETPVENLVGNQK
jgi:hypothetical protein